MASIAHAIRRESAVAYFLSIKIFACSYQLFVRNLIRYDIFLTNYDVQINVSQKNTCCTLGKPGHLFSLNSNCCYYNHILLSGHLQLRQLQQILV